MQLIILEQRRWKVAALMKERSSKPACEALEFLANCEQGYQASAKGMKALFGGTQAEVAKV